MLLSNMTFDDFATQLEKTFDLNRKSNRKVTRKEAAKMLSVSVPMIDKLIRGKKLKKYKIGSKTLLDASQVESLLS